MPPTYYALPYGPICFPPCPPPPVCVPVCVDVCPGPLGWMGARRAARGYCPRGSIHPAHPAYPDGHDEL